MQEDLTIGEITIPVWNEGGELWYPLSTIERVFYKRDKVSKSSRLKIEEFCKMVDMKFGYGINPTVVCNEEGLKNWIENKNIGRMTVEQKTNHNTLRDYFNLEKISSKENLTLTLPKDSINKYGEIQRMALMNYIENTDECDRVYALCQHCGVYYPADEKFFNKHTTAHMGLTFSKCKLCMNLRIKTGYDKIDSLTQYGKNLCNQLDLNISDFHDNIEFYKKSLNIFEYIPIKYINKDFIDEIFIYLKDNFVFTKDELCDYNLFCKKIKIKNIVKYYKRSYIVKYFDEDAYYKPYKYNYYVDDDTITEEYMVNVLKNYIDEYNIDYLNHKFELDWIKLLGNRDTRLFSLIKRSPFKSVWNIVLALYEYKYPLYKFNMTTPVGYYTDDYNLEFAVKYLIEQDLKLEINKIPLYITNYFLQREYRPLYYAIKEGNNSHSSIYSVINKLYPDKFIELDFNVNIKRNVFDSVEESNIHDILSDKFGSQLIYNQGNMSERFYVGEHQPDWIVIKEKPLLIEYFGMYIKNQTGNTRIDYYIDKADRKINNYNLLEHYDMLYIYPEDLKFNFKGLYSKLEDH